MIEKKPFSPPSDWESVYAASPSELRFGSEPSMLCRSTVSYFQAFGGNCQGACAMDVGCGEGRDSIFLARTGFQTTAIDPAKSGLNKLREWAKQAGVVEGSIQCIHAGISEMVIEPNSVDLVLAANVLQFLKPSAVPQQVARLLSSVKHGGALGVGVFHPKMKEWGANVGANFCATADELADLFPMTEGWQVVDRTEYTTFNVGLNADAAFSFVVAYRH